MTAQAKDIAVAYCAILAQWLEPNELALVHSGEAWPDDFCDGNMAMAEAFDKLGIVLWDDEHDHMRDDALSIWNAAYDLSQANGFNMVTQA